MTLISPCTSFSAQDPPAQMESGEEMKSPQSTVPNLEQGSPQPPQEGIGAEDLELLEHLEMWEALEMLENMEMYEDMDSLIHESPQGEN